MILEHKLPFGYIFKAIKDDLLVVLGVGIATNLFTILFHPLLPDMPLSIPALLGTAISILLSFKMNQSYDRWWEARKVWGAIVNDSRTLVIQLQSFLSAENKPMIQQMAYRQIAWCSTLAKALRGFNPTEGFEHLISQQEQAEIAKQTNKPLAILQGHAKDLKQLRDDNLLETLTHLQLDNTLTRLCESMGRAERINGTVFPSYRIFLHYIIYLFIVTLAISLRQVNMLFEIPLLLFIAASFFSIEKSAYLLQDPFTNRPSDVPVTAIATTIEINIRQLLGEAEVPEPEKAQGFFIM